MILSLTTLVQLAPAVLEEHSLCLTALTAAAQDSTAMTSLAAEAEVKVALILQQV
jgi:hypothetical protein